MSYRRCGHCLRPGHDRRTCREKSTPREQHVERLREELRDKFCPRQAEPESEPEWVLRTVLMFLGRLEQPAERRRVCLAALTQVQVEESKRVRLVVN